MSPIKLCFLCGCNSKKSTFKESIVDPHLHHQFVGWGISHVWGPLSQRLKCLRIWHQPVRLSRGYPRVLFIFPFGVVPHIKLWSNLSTVWIPKITSCSNTLAINPFFWENYNKSLTWNKAILGMISLYVHHDHCEIAVRSLFASPRVLVGLTPYSNCTGGIFRSNPGGSSKSDDWNKIKY